MKRNDMKETTEKYAYVCVLVKFLRKSFVLFLRVILRQLASELHGTCLMVSFHICVCVYVYLLTKF